MAAYRAFKDAHTVETWQQWLKAIEWVTEWSWKKAMSTVVAAVLHAGSAEVTLVPTGLIGLLPLHAASYADPSVPGELRFAIDDLLIRYAPNARVMVESLSTKRSTEADSLMAVGETSSSEGLDLVGAVDELRAVAATFAAEKTTLLQDGDATRGNVLAGLQSRSVVHFACHGAANAEDPLESFLLLADNERLTLRDILSKRLPRARLVVLSACESAIIGTRLPDEVIGFPAGLLQGGSAAVIGSLWSVDDLATSALLSRFYTLWRQEGVEMSEALRRAQRWLRDLTAEERNSALPGVRANSDGPDANPYSHPFYWAAFQFTGV